eukprot:scaffold980_cov248-Pinguiococcus_pyrenoidosus.AAC.12
MLEDDFLVSLDAGGRIEDTVHPWRFAAWEGLVGGLDSAAFDELLADARLCNTGFLRQTYWIAHASAPRFALESLASEVYAFHAGRLPAAAQIDPEKSGAEWWVQVRQGTAATQPPGPATRGAAGDAAAAGPDRGDDEDALNTSSTMAFHFDKDEVLHEHTGLYVHPQLSTVTYLTTAGAPTVILEATSKEVLEGRDKSTSVDSSFVSFPVQGKHAAFDGRYLHGVISDFPPPMDAEGLQEPSPVRATLLVNVWFNFRPCGVRPFPSTLASKMASLPKVRLKGDCPAAISVPHADFQELSRGDDGRDEDAVRENEAPAMRASVGDVLRTLEFRFSRTGRVHLVRLPVAKLPTGAEATSFMIEHADDRSRPAVIEDALTASPAKGPGRPSQSEGGALDERHPKRQKLP